MVEYLAPFICVWALQLFFATLFGYVLASKKWVALPWALLLLGLTTCAAVSCTAELWPEIRQKHDERKLDRLARKDAKRRAKLEEEKNQEELDSITI